MSNISTTFNLPGFSASKPHPTDSYEEYRNGGTPLVIDNGSASLRWGFSTALLPRSGPNVISKYRERKSNKQLLLFGDGLDADSTSKSQAKMPWEGDVLLNFDGMEHALDYAFTTLGIDTSSIEHPIIFSERLSTPLHSRTLTSELLFELYSVPSTAYCVDSIMSFYHNNTTDQSSQHFTSDGLVVSFNTSSTSVIPILNGKGIMSQAKRIPWGASQASEYLLKLIQLKYPTFPTRVTPHQSSWMLQTFCEFSTDYPSLLRRLKDPLQLKASERIIQFPFVASAQEEKSDAELARLAERRREQGKKLQEMQVKMRAEKLAQKEEDLAHLLELRERRGIDSKREWQNKLDAEGFEDEEIFDETIKKLENDIKRARKKDPDEDEVLDEPSFPLVDVPDADLDEDNLKEKRRQKLMKAGYEARLRARQEKERELELRAAEEKREEDERVADLDGWARKLRHEQEALMTRIKERVKRKAALSDRKSAASQARMKSIASLAADDRVPKKKRKAGSEDMFGANDSDWAIYRKINAAAASSDEEEDLMQLHTVEQKLLAHDPTFAIEDTHAALTTQKSALITAFRPQYPEGDNEGATRIHLNTERWRACEVWFSPSMAGVDSAGLHEVIYNILSTFPEAEKGRLAKNIFLTGSPVALPGLADRLYAEIRPVLPPEMPINIVKAFNPTLDAWYGMARFANTGRLPEVSVTKEEYEEWGGERIKRWWGGNWNYSVTEFSKLDRAPSTDHNADGTMADVDDNDNGAPEADIDESEN